jgi:hypothetical protein
MKHRAAALSFAWPNLLLPLTLAVAVPDACAQGRARVYERAASTGVGWVDGGGYYDTVDHLHVVLGATSLREWNGAGVASHSDYWGGGPRALCEYPDPERPGWGMFWSPTMGTWGVFGNWMINLGAADVPVPASAGVLRRQLAWDHARDKAMLIVETANPPATVVWQFDTGGWNWLGWWSSTLPLPPGTDRLGGMTFDPVRGGIVALTDAGAFLWDDVAWHAVPAPTGYLPGRALAFDATRQRLVAFGGGSGGTVSATTLEWDGTAWQAITPSVSPPARTGASLIWDPLRQQCILCGGRSAAGAVVDDIWGFDGTTWIDHSQPTVRPPALTEACAADIAAGTFMFGGRDASGNATNQTWRWDGTQWANVTGTGPSPQPRSAAAMTALDPNTILLFGGRAQNGAALNDTWLYTGAGGWTLQSASGPYAGRYDAALCSDGAGRAWLYGGNNGGTVLGDFWRFTSAAGTWSYVPPGGPGSSLVMPREKCTLAYDRRRARVVLFGGRNVQNPVLGLTMDYDPSTSGWYLPSITTEPGVLDHAMAYDTGKDRTVIVGGYDPTSGFHHAAAQDWDGGPVWQASLNSTQLIRRRRRPACGAAAVRRRSSRCRGGRGTRRLPWRG